MIPGQYAVKGCCKLNNKRLQLAEYNNKPDVKKRRKIIRGSKKSKDDVGFEKEGDLYIPGGCSYT